MTKTPKQVLQDARRLIEEKGWIQGLYHSERGYCVSGAIYQAGGWRCVVYQTNSAEAYQTNSAEALVAADRAWSALQKEIGFAQSIAGWNDEPGRTKEEVLATFDRAIERVE